MNKIKIPYNFTPRLYQLPLLQAIDSGVKRAFCLWHRRAGKDKVLFNILISRAVQFVGTHYYLLPTYAQAKKVIWDGIDNDGFKFVDHIPRELIKNKNGQEMKIELINGSIIQLVGTDNYDSIRGTNPITCIFSEYAWQNPQAWEVIKPILKLNGGIAIFNTTPLGKNHAFDLYEMAQKIDDWFVQLLTIDDTKLLSEEDIKRERAEGTTEDMILQEYYCSFEAAIKGAYYADELKKVHEQKRVCKSIYDANLDVYTAWDLGLSDDTAIVFYQLFGKEIRVIDFYANSGMTLPEYIQMLKEKPYKYKKHYFPWDARIRALSSGKSSFDVAKEYGLEVEIVPNVSVNDGIQQVRMVFDRCWFDEEKTFHLINSLSQYRREYDDKRQIFRANPLHDWTSHAADAFRYMAISIKEEQPDNIKESQNAYLQFLKRGSNLTLDQKIYGIR